MLNSLIGRLGRGKLTVLVFHKVSKPDSEFMLDDQLSFDKFCALIDNIRDRFHVAPLANAIADLRAGTLSRPTVSITFDDGHASWVGDILPFLLSRGLHATFFVSTGQLNGARLWNERIETAIECLPPEFEVLHLKSVDLGPISLRGTNARRHAFETLSAAVKYWSVDERERCLIELEALSNDQTRGRRFDESAVLALHKAGMAIGCHTVNHPILTTCSAEEALAEIRDSKLHLERITGAPVLGFAYPNGRPELDYQVRHVDMVKSLGFDYAVSTERGYANGRTPILQIPRFTPWRTSRFGQLAQMLHNLIIAKQAYGVREKSSKAVTMVAFHFPPQVGSSGILRTLTFIRELPKFGWRVGVVSACSEAYEKIDGELSREIPNSVAVVRAHAFDSKKCFSVKGHYPELLALPDRWWTWFFAGRHQGVLLSRWLDSHVIWSTYPILTAHLIAAAISRSLGKPWVAEFRDPAFHEEWGYGHLRAVVLRHLEAWVVRRCSLCVLATESTRQLYSRRYPKYANKLHVIPNGFDEQAFNDLLPQRFGVPEQRFMMYHSGAIYPKERDPSTFFEAMRSFMAQEGLGPNDLVVRFRASGADQAISAIAKAMGLESCVEFEPAQPYRAALSEMAGSDLLLVFQGTAFNNQIPAKVYEYLRTLRPIFAVVDPRGATADLLNDHVGVRIADCSNTALIAQHLAEAYRAHRARSEPSQESVRSLESVAQFSRQHGAQALSKLLCKIGDLPDD